MGLLYRAAGIARVEGVSIEPEVVQLVEEVYEHQTVKVLLQIKNNYSKPILLRKVDSSCGCMGVVTSGNQPILQPLRVSPGQYVPIQVAIPTDQLSGPQQYKVGCEAEIDGQIVEGVSTIHLNVLAGLRADPPKVFFRDAAPFELHTQEVTILDSYPDPGIRLASPVESSSEAISAKLVSLDDSRPIDQSKLKKRYMLRIRCTPPKLEGTMEHSLRLVPMKKGQPDLLIPVIITTSASDYQLTPASLLLFGSKKNLKRTVVCEINGTPPDRFDVLRSPSFAIVNVTSLDKKRRAIEIELDSNAIELPVEAEIVFGDKATGKEYCKLPLNLTAEPSL